MKNNTSNFNRGEGSLENFLRLFPSILQAKTAKEDQI